MPATGPIRRHFRPGDEVRTGRSSRPTDRFVTALLAFSLVLGASGQAIAQDRTSGIQMSPDSHRYLINKDVGTERWAITYDLASKTITGNVFYPDGRPPQFLWCGPVSAEPSDNPQDSQLMVDCYAAEACTDAPCTDQAWSFVARVAVSGSFLLPPGTLSTLSGNVQPILTQNCATSGACHASDGRTPRLAEGLFPSETVDVPAEQDSSKVYVAPFDPDGSYLFDKILGIASNGSTMPPDAPPLDGNQTEDIRRWILEGAADN